MKKAKKETNESLGSEIIQQIERWLQGVSYESKLTALLTYHLLWCKSPGYEDVALESLAQFEDMVLGQLGKNVEPEMTAFTCGFIHRITECGRKTK